MEEPLLPMLPEDSYARFRAFLKERNRTLKSLSLEEGAGIALDFYSQVRTVGTSAKMGDGVFYAWGIYNRGRGGRFEFSVIRLFALDDKCPGQQGSRLRLSFCYPWLDAVRWNGQPDGSLLPGNSEFVLDQTGIEGLRSKMLAHPMFKMLTNRLPKVVELRYENSWDVT